MASCENDELNSEMEKLSINETKIKNRGTGAGGANTNKNGLEFERKVDLKKIIK